MAMSFLINRAQKSSKNKSYTNREMEEMWWLFLIRRLNPQNNSQLALINKIRKTHVMDFISVKSNTNAGKRERELKRKKQKY